LLAGCVLCALQRPEEAKVAFKKAIESQPEHSIEVRMPLCTSVMTLRAQDQYEHDNNPASCE
jgi:hypothetical protein